MNEKERKMVYSCHCQMWKLFVGLLLGAAVHIVHVQAVLSPDVTVTTDAWVDDQGRTTMTCSTTDTVDELEWLFSDISETDVNGATLIFKYASFAGSVTPGATIDATRFEFTGPGGSDNYPLVIKSVELGDERKYWCRILTASFDTIENNSTLRIRVKPTIILLEDPRTGMNYSSGSVEVIQGLNHFACIVQGIKPEAEFTWTLDSVTLSGSVETHVPNSEDARLVDSRSEQNFTVLGDSALACSAHNKQDGTTSPDKTVTVQLKPIKDPCEPNPCENGGTCTPKPSLDGYQCDCPPGTVEPNCTASTTPESPAKSTTIGGPGPSTPTGPSNMTDGLGAGAIAGIVLGALTATGVVSILGFVYYIKKIKPLHSPKLSTEDTGSKHKKSFDGIKDKSEAGGSPELDEVEMQDQRKESLDGRNSEDCVSGHSSDLPEIEIELEGQEKESSESSSEESKSEQSYDFDAIDMEGHGKESSESGSEENQMGFSGSNGTDTQDHLNKSFQGSSEESEVFI